MYNDISLRFLKDFILENSFLEKSLKITLLNLQNLVVSFNQINKTISFVKSQQREIYVYVSDPYVFHFYTELFDRLKGETNLTHINVGNKKDLFLRLKKKDHNIGLIFYLNTAEEARSNDKVENYALNQNVLFFSGTFTKNNSSRTKDLNKILFPVQINNIKNNILFALFLILT